MSEWAPLIVVALAFSPVGEVRASVPVAMLHFGMGWGEAFTWSLVGNLLVGPAAWWAYPRLEALARRWAWLAGRLDRLYERTRRRSGKRVERLEEMAVALVIAVPVPGSGAWTGGLVAHVFGLGPRKAAGPFYVGVVGATALATALVATGSWAFPFLYGP